MFGRGKHTAHIRQWLQSPPPPPYFPDIRTSCVGVASIQQLIEGTSSCTLPRVFLLAFLETNPCQTLYPIFVSIKGLRYCTFPPLSTPSYPYPPSTVLIALQCTKTRGKACGYHVTLYRQIGEGGVPDWLNSFCRCMQSSRFLYHRDQVIITLWRSGSLKNLGLSLHK